MHHRKRAILIVFTTLMLGLAACIGLLPQTARATGPGAEHFPNVSLTTQDGKTVRFFDDLIKGKSMIINFIYTKCGDSCPLETARLAQVQRLLGDRVGQDIFFYSISIDPQRDTPAELKAYANKFHARPGWLFLTGKKADIDLIRKSLGQAAGPGEDELKGHSTMFIIGDEPSGQWMRDSSLDNPQYISAMVGDWLSSGRHHQRGRSYAEATRADAPSTERGTCRKWPPDPPQGTLQFGSEERRVGKECRL